MSNNKKNTDRLIQQKALNHEFEFADHAWDKMEHLLDDGPTPATRSNHFFNFRNLTIMILLLVILIVGGLMVSDPSPPTPELVVTENSIELETPPTPTMEVTTLTTTEAAPETKAKKTLLTSALTSKAIVLNPEPWVGDSLMVPFILPLSMIDSNSLENILTRKLSAHHDHYAPDKVYLHLDRKFFYPGEDVWFSVYLRDANSLKRSEKSDFVWVELLGPNGSVLQKRRLLAAEGQVRGDFTLPQGAEGGLFKIKAYSNWQRNLGQYFERDLQVQSVVLPSLRMELDFLREAYGAGDKVEAKISLQSLENQPLPLHPVKAVVSLDGQAWNTYEATTDARGKAWVSFQLPDDLATDQALLNVQLELNGQGEAISRAIPIVKRDIDLQFLPEGGDMIAGLQGRIAFKALNEHGKPADVEGAIYNQLGEKVADFRSYHMGMGAFQLTPDLNDEYYAEIHKPAGIDEPIPLPEPLERGYNLIARQVSADLLRVTVRSTEDEALSIALRAAGQVAKVVETPARRGTHRLEIPTNQLPIGVAEITLFDSKQIPRAERLVFLHPEKRLDIEVSTDKERYLPREEVKMTVQVKDERGMPMPGKFSLAVVDDNLLTFADDKQGDIMAYLLLESELTGDVEEPNFYFDPAEDHPEKDQLQALDYLMLTQGWRRFNWSSILGEPLASIQYPSEMARLGGRVMDARGVPISNAKIGFGSLDDAVESNENGAFELRDIDMPQYGDYLWVEHDGKTLTFPARNYQMGMELRWPVEPSIIFNSTSERGIIRGQVTDALTGEAMIGASVFVEELQIGASADFDGNFVINDVPPGTYNLQCQYIGYTPMTSPVTVKANAGVQANVAITVDDVALEEVVVTGYNVPLIEQDNTVSGAVITSEQIRKLPTKDISALASTVAGLKSTEGASLTIRGSRNEATNYYVDGIRVRGDALADRRQIANNTSDSNRGREFYSPRYEAEEMEEEGGSNSRNDFRSTIYWNPEVEVDRRGKAELSFFTSDALTTFRVSVEGLSADGGIGQHKFFFFSQQPLGMRTKVPGNLLTGDQLRLPVQISNNTQAPLTGQLQINTPTGFELTSETKPSYTLAAGTTKTVFLTYNILPEAQSGQFDIHFTSGDYADYFQQPVRVQPRGFPVEQVLNGDQKEQEFTFNILDPVAESVHLNFQAYPDLSEVLMTGMDRMLRQPNGCFEQTSSSNYPNLLVLDYLEHSQQIRPDIRERAMNFLRAGYERLLTFEVEGGGFDWYGQAPSNEALTAYGLLQFKDMQAVYSVDEDLIQRTAAWLIGRRDGQGSWTRSTKRALHSWQGATATADAYIVWALTEAGYSQDILPEIEKTYQQAVESEDPYQMALLSNVLLEMKDRRGKDLLNELLKLQLKDGSWKGDQPSMTRSTGQALAIETTALTVLAMIKDNQKGAPLREAIRFIVQSKSNYGFGNTQSTVLAMKALVAFTKTSKRTRKSGEIKIWVNDNLETISYKSDQSGGLELDLSAHGRAGENKVRVIYERTKRPLDFDLDLKYTTRQPQADPGCLVRLNTKLAKASGKSGQTIRLTTKLQNTLEQRLPNTIALVGIPAGLSVQPWQLKKMQEEGQFDYYEMIGSYVVFHYRSLAPGVTHELALDLKAEVPGTYEAPASVAYLYYTNEYKSWSKPEAVTIVP